MPLNYLRPIICQTTCGHFDNCVPLLFLFFVVLLFLLLFFAVFIVVFLLLFFAYVLNLFFSLFVCLSFWVGYVK